MMGVSHTADREDLDVLDATFTCPDLTTFVRVVNGRLEHLRGSALGFRNLTNYIARSFLETGGFRPRLHPGL
jgi:transposase